MKRVKELKNKLLPHLPTGEMIPGIVKDSMSISQTEIQADAGIAVVQLQLFVYCKDIEY